MVQKYQNEISPTIYYGISIKTNEKDLKIPNLQLPDWKHPYWMSLYVSTCYGHNEASCSIDGGELQVVLREGGDEAHVHHDDPVDLEQSEAEREVESKVMVQIMVIWQQIPEPGNCVLRSCDNFTLEDEFREPRGNKERGIEPMNQPNETRNGWKDESGKDALKWRYLFAMIAKRESSHNHEDTEDEKNEGYKKTSFVDRPYHS